jgi:hypothetical protein
MNPRYDFDAFVQRIKLLDRHEMIRKADAACGGAENASYDRPGAVNARESGSTIFASRLKDLLYFLHYGSLPNSLFSDTALYKEIAESLVAKGQWNKNALDQFGIKAHSSLLKPLHEQLQILDGIPHKSYPSHYQNKTDREFAAIQFAQFLLTCGSKDEAAHRADQDDFALFAFLECASRLLASFEAGRLEPKIEKVEERFPFYQVASIVEQFLNKDLDKNKRP